MTSRDSFLPVFVNIVNDAKKYIEYEIFGNNSYASKLTYLMFGLIKKITLSFVDFNFFHWLVLSAFIWTIVHGIYKTCIKLLLRRVGVGGQDCKQLTETIWQLCFTLVSVPIVCFCVGGNTSDIFNLLGGWALRLDYQLSKCKIHEDVELPGVKTLFVLHSSFYAHEMLNTWYVKGFKNLEFLQKQMFLAIFMLTYYSKCPLLGLSLLFLLLRPALMCLLSKLCCLLSHFTFSVLLTKLAMLLCGSYQLFWICTFFYHLPMFLLMGKTIDSEMLKAEIKMLIVLDIMIWFFIFTTIFTSTFSRIMLSLVLSSKDRPYTIEYFLFGSDPWLLRLTSFNHKRLSLEDNSSEDDGEERRRSRARAALIQTIQCSIILKRKVRRIREEKERRLKTEKQEESL